MNELVDLFNNSDLLFKYTPGVALGNDNGRQSLVAKLKETIDSFCELESQTRESIDFVLLTGGGL